MHCLPEKLYSVFTLKKVCWVSQIFSPQCHSIYIENTSLFSRQKTQVYSADTLAKHTCINDTENSWEIRNHCCKQPFPLKADCTSYNNNFNIPFCQVIFPHFRYTIELFDQVAAFIPATHSSLSVAFASVQGVCEPKTVHVSVGVFKALMQMLAQQGIF